MDKALPHLPQALIEGCKKGDHTSQKKLYKHFYGFSMAICLRYSRTRDEAAEIMNDGFLNVFTNISRYDDEKPFKPWLSRIMTNKAIDHYRSQMRHATTTDIADVEEPGAEPEIHAKLNYNDLLVLVQGLPDGYRAVFNLYAIDGYTHEEIGKLLGISVGTSKSNLFKARQKLRALLGGISNNNRQEERYNNDGASRQGSDGSVFQGNPEFTGPKV